MFSPPSKGMDAIRFLLRRQRSKTMTTDTLLSSLAWTKPPNLDNNTLESEEKDSSTSSSVHAFDRHLKRCQRDNAARMHQKWQKSNVAAGVISYDYIRDEIASRLVDRLDDIRRDGGFPLALDVGSGAGYVHKAICSEPALEGIGGMGGVQKLVQLDSCESMLFRDENQAIRGGELCETYRLAADEEGPLPFPDNTFDLVLSSASLHWVNALPNTISEIHRVLKPDACFLWAMIGGSTLSELRQSLLLAELEREGGVSPRVGPFCGIADVGSLLQNARFTLPTIDVDTFRVSFPNATILMEHLQRMGENNACIQRKQHGTSRDTFLATACIYDHLFGFNRNSTHENNNNDNNNNARTITEVEASVNVIYAIGWKAHKSQQQPLQRGSATERIREHLEKDRE